MDDKMMDDMNLSWNGEVMMKYDGEKRWNMEKVDGDMMGENDNPPQSLKLLLYNVHHPFLMMYWHRLIYCRIYHTWLEPINQQPFLMTIVYIQTQKLFFPYV